MSLVSQSLRWGLPKYECLQKGEEQGVHRPSLQACPYLKGVWGLLYHYCSLAQSHRKMDTRPVHLCFPMAKGSYVGRIKGYYFH